MVSTQARRLIVALTALAAIACPLTGANAAPGDDGEVVIAVDGNVHEGVAKEVVSPVDLPLPVGDVARAAELTIRTYDIVLDNPAGTVYHAAPPMTFTGMDHEAITVDAPGQPLVVPWYYMMDDDSIQPYHAFFWDTGTDAYAAWADQVYTDYAVLAPGAPASPFGAVERTLPGVHFQTSVAEIQVGASLNVLLHSVLASADGASYALGGAPASDASLLALPGETASPSSLAPASEHLDGFIVGTALPGSQAAAIAPQAFASPSALASMPAAVAAVGAAGALALFALYHLIRKSAILKNKVRSTIAEHVLRQPGSTITEIAQAVGVTHQTASYHLRLLQEHGLVLGVERGNKRLYFRNDGSFNQEERRYVAVLRDAESMRVLNLIRANPWIMKNEAAAALGVSRNTLNWHLQKLISAGLVSEARENGYCFLFCNRKASDELLGVVQQKVDERKSPEGAPAPAPASAPAAELPAPPAFFGAAPREQGL